ncbi:DUF302 domain-containing protein [bacterium]|nr:DUF302 domain-containing protein [bacterium]MBU1872486.1 DUF302 domain-containing protein [bacterium]
MPYYFSKVLASEFDDAIQKVTEALKTEGFGVLSRIDVQKAMQEKMGVNFQKYQILGACNPSFAYQALLAEDKIGTMLPCNIIVQELNEGQIEVAAIDPVASMQAIQNEELASIAIEVRDKLKDVIANL